jgi:hypothetical protein
MVQILTAARRRTMRCGCGGRCVRAQLQLNAGEPPETADGRNLRGGPNPRQGGDGTRAGFGAGSVVRRPAVKVEGRRGARRTAKGAARARTRESCRRRARRRRTGAERWRRLD